MNESDATRIEEQYLTARRRVLPFVACACRREAFVQNYCACFLFFLPIFLRVLVIFDTPMNPSLTTHARQTSEQDVHLIHL